MYKLLLSLFLFTNLSFAGLINGLAILVNEEPITLYDIDKVMEDKGLSKNNAVSFLVDKTLYEQEIKKYSIEVDIFETDAYIQRLAASNKMDLYSFKSLIRQKYKDYEIFEKEIKENILRQKLIEKVVKSKLKVATTEDLEIFYENNKNKFSSSSIVKAVEYASKNKRDLQVSLENPMAIINTLSKTNIEIDMSKINPKLKFILNDTKQNSFTPIFISNKRYVSLLITEKSNTLTRAFGEVKDKIFIEVMKTREKKALKEYFEKLKLTADIKIIR